MIIESGKISMEKRLKKFLGNAIGPRDFSVFRAEIISDILKGTKGAMKNEFPNLSPIKSTGGFIGYRYTFSDVVRNIYKESILNVCNNRWVGCNITI